MITVSAQKVSNFELFGARTAILARGPSYQTSHLRRASQAALRSARNTGGMRILVVDDDRAVRESLRRSLAFNGYTVDLAADGQQALDAVVEQRPDAMVLDVMMPRLDGLEVCRRLRGTGDDLPILVLTARDAVSDRVAGLDAGADDYLPKPFALEELLARLRALLRRRFTGPEDPGEPAALRFADLSLDLGTREVIRAGRSISLTRTEFALLELLMRNPRQVLTRSRILEDVWGYDFPTSGNALEVYVGYLRRKTEAAGEPRLIHTVRGVGYALRESPP
jgi:two-component system, OmpR family, response regulator MprA